MRDDFYGLSLIPETSYKVHIICIHTHTVLFLLTKLQNLKQKCNYEPVYVNKYIFIKTLI